MYPEPWTRVLHPVYLLTAYGVASSSAIRVLTNAHLFAILSVKSTVILDTRLVTMNSLKAEYITLCFVDFV